MIKPTNRPPEGEELTRRLNNIAVHVMTEVTPRPQKRRASRPVLIAGGIGLAVAIAGSAAAALAWLPAQVDEVFCYPEADLSAYSAGVTGTEPTYSDPVTGEQKNHPGWQVSPLDPIQACTALWEAGVVEHQGPGPIVPSDAPPLVACILPSGSGAAFPKGTRYESSADLCTDLGLSPWRSTANE